jgi:hypothetical protein
MRSSKKQTAPVWNAGSGSRLLKSAPADDYTAAEISASIYSGRTLLGFIVDEPGHTAALAPDRTLIGLFSDRRQATLAILIHPRGAPTPA